MSSEQIQQLIEQGHFLEARAEAIRALENSDDLRLQQLYALSLSKSGAAKAAEDFLAPIYRRNPDDPETAGILGGIYKELFRKSQDPQYALLSRDTYQKNFALTRSTYTGINAAAMAVMAGHASKGKETAREIVSIIDPETDDPWEAVTLAEALLLTKNTQAATNQYLTARKMMRSDWGMVTSVYNQIWLLNHYIAVPKTVLQAFHPPGVAAFVGHMIDRPDRKTQRFPSYIEPKVKDALIAAMQTFNIKIGYSSLACGGDIIFCEALAATGGEINIILGFDRDDFLEESVRYAGAVWTDRFTKLVDEHPVTFISNEKYQGTRDLFPLQSKMILGSAFHRGTLLQTQAYLLTTLSETDSSIKEGGTRDTIKLWPFPQRWINVNPDLFIVGEKVVPGITAPRQAPKTMERAENREVRYLIMLRIPGQSISAVGKTLEELLVESLSSDQVDLMYMNDTFVAAFKGIQDAAVFAHNAIKGLNSLEEREPFTILLHAGPVCLEQSEVKSISGPQIEMMQELSTTTLPGILYATAPAAMLLSLPPDRYAFEFSGSLKSSATQTELEMYQVQQVH